MSDCIPVCFVNKLSERRWQPRLAGGDKLWKDNGGLTWHHLATAYGHRRPRPKLYRSRARAVRVAKRRERGESRQFEEVIPPYVR